MSRTRAASRLLEVLDPVTGNRTGAPKDSPFFADTDWFTPVTTTATATRTDTLGEDFRAWRSEFPAYDGGGYSDSLSITPQDVRTALGPQADELMATANVDVDELIRLINAETTVLPVIPDELSAHPQVWLTGEAPPTGVATAVKRWKHGFLKSTIAAVLVTLIGGGAAAIMLNKAVTVDVDGQAQTVHTYASTVGEVLDKQGIKVGEHDSLSPSPNASIGDGGKIVVHRGRMLHLTVDGVQKDMWVRATTVGEAIQQLNMVSQGMWMSRGAEFALPLNGMALEVRTSKSITLFDGGNLPRSLTTNAVTVDDLLRDLRLTVGP